MAKYKAYPEYKDSRVEWLGDLPGHWKLSKLRYQFAFGKGLTITKEHLQDEGIPCVNYGEVHSKYGFEVNPEIHTLKCVSDKYLKDNSSSLLTKGDIVFADTSEDIDGSGNFTQLVSDSVTFAGYHTIIARPFERDTSRFYAYLLDCKELRSQVRHAVKGVKVFSITQAILRNLSIWLPTKDEQAKIAAFLDHETAKIDNLIDKQQQLVELLKEKGQAVISHAVTKGLNPDVPMKDSGVEWLGEVPEHWIPARLKYHTRQIVDGAHFTPTYTEKGIPFLRVTDIQDKYIDCEGVKFIPKHEHKELIKRCKPENGDLLLSKNGTIGVPKLIDWDWEFSIFVSLCLIKFKDTLTSAYSEFFFRSHEIKEQVFGLIKKSTVINLHLDKIQNFWFCIPPLEEQYNIVNYLNGKIDTLECLIESAELTIRLAQERRTALISAAVTGKIDVRDWVAPDMQDAEEPQETTA
ncbi:restriction endonuclease subunit S [Serratia marcescens]|uniref:restriction endonuclease subunit S n=1 Tax=Serratia marcescens TaxID=615 RepID=UPI0034D47379